jgi:hypothetical protein
VSVRRVLLVEAGALVRGQLRRAVETGAWRYGVQCHTDESKSFGRSTYRFTLTGPQAVVDALASAIEDMVRQAEARQPPRAATGGERGNTP